MTDTNSFLFWSPPRRDSESQVKIVLLKERPHSAEYGISVNFGASESRFVPRSWPDHACPLCDNDYSKVENRVAVSALVRSQPEQYVSVPVIPKRHKKRRNQTEAYHRRVQKKWDKRVLGLTVRVLKTDIVALNLPRSLIDKIKGLGRPT